MKRESLLARSVLKWLEASGNMFMDVDCHFRLILTDKALQERFGAVEGETCYGSMFQISDPCPGCPVKAIVDGAATAEAEFVRKDRTGQSARLRMIAVPIYSPLGDLLGARALLLDVTDQQTSGLPRGDLTFPGRALVEAAPDMIFALDQTGRFSFANAFSEQILGKGVEQILGSALWDYTPLGHELLSREILAVRPGEVWDGELDIVGPETTKKHVRIRCAPTTDLWGRVSGFVGVLRDRTPQQKLEEELKSYEESLKESEERYRNLVEDVPDIIFSLDNNGRINFINCQVERLLGYTVSQMLERPLWDYVSEESAELAKTLLLTEAGATWDEELWVVDAKGDRKWVRTRCRPHTDSKGWVIRYDGVMRDRTSTRRLEEELRASKLELMEKIRIIDDLYQHIVQAEKSKAIAMHTAEVAHELRQPLAIIGGFARRMAKHLESCNKLDPASERECFQIILNEVERLEKILSGLVDFTTLNEVAVQPVNPSDTIEDVLQINAERLAEKDLRLQLKFQDDAAQISVDPNRFHRVVRNLVANAIDASPPQGLIRIETGIFTPSARVQKTGDLKSEGYFELRVLNSGPPIPAEDIQRVFDPFFTTKDMAAGIGLTLTKKIVEEHGGSVSVKSDDDGTIFSVWLPVKPSAARKP